ncbi:MAG TPA: hypothetical protein PLL10_09305 [Elusimicrobiales bacterium]|nr:hypothetical protein [Elusimicrobiales bacterium]
MRKVIIVIGLSALFTACHAKNVKVTAQESANGDHSVSVEAQLKSQGK